MTRFRPLLISFLWLVVVGGGIIYPFYAVISAVARTQISFVDFLKLIFSSEILSTVRLTLAASITALAAAFFISVPAALLLKSKTRKSETKKFAHVIELVLQVAWVLPAFLYALIIIEGFRQIRQINPNFELYSMRTVWVAWVVVAIPFLTISFLRGLRDLDERESEMVQVLGANRWQRFRVYELPKLMPMIRGSLLHQMWLYLTSFTLVVILGGGPPYETLEVGVYTSVRLDQLNYTRALALSLWQIAILVAIRLALKRTHDSNVRVGIEWMEHDTQAKRHFKHGLSRNQWIALGAVVFIFVRALLITDGLPQAFTTGVLLSALVAALSMVYTLTVYYLRQSFLAEVGAWMSPMVLALAWWKAYAFSAPSLLICVLIQVILLSPWIARIFFPILARERTLEIEAVRTLGARPWQAWKRVEWPRLKSQAYWMTAMVFGLSLSEVSTVILFSRGDFEPLSVWIQNQMSRFQFASAFEGTLVLIAVSVSALIMVRKR